MKNLWLIGVVVFALASCGGGPDVCDCVDNAVKIGSSDYKESLQKECEEYAKNLSNEDRLKRAQEAFKCLEKK